MSSPAKTAPPIILSREDSGRQGDSIRIALQGSGMQQRLGQQIGLTGWAVLPQEVSEWRLGGSFASDGWLYVELPATDLQPLSAALQLPRAQGLEILERYCRAIELLAEREDRPLRPVNLQSVYFDKRGTIWILPPGIEDTIAKNLSDEDHRLWYNHWAPSTGSAEQRAAYQCAAILYGVLTGNPPASDEDTVIRHPHLYLPELADEPAEALYRLLRRDETAPLADIRSLLTRVRKGEAFDAPYDEQRRERISHAETRLRKQTRAYRRRNFWRKSAPTLAVSAIAVAVLLLFLSPFFSGSEKAVTLGLDQVEVIELFYRSHNSLDHETISDCAAGASASAHMNEVTTLFVINRVRQGVEGIKPFMSVEEWKKQGRPAPGRDTFVYGIDDLQIRSLGSDSYEAVYTKYTTMPPSREAYDSAASEDELREQAKELQSTGKVQAYKVTERITMKSTNEGWKIATLELLDQRDIDPAEQVEQQ